MAGLAPAVAIDRLLQVPYAAGAGCWTGADCWGVVELWYRSVLGIDVADRGDLPPGNASVQAWSEQHLGWRRTEAPEDHCVALLRMGPLDAGHVGIVFATGLLHSASAHGCVYQPLSDRLIRAKITGYLLRK